MADNAQFSVADFSSRIAKNGLASPNKFEVIFKRIPGADQNDLTQLSLMCDQVSLAGRDVQAVLDLQYGIRRQVAYNAPAYTPLSVSFLCTDQMLEKTILDKWNNFIVPNKKGKVFDVEYYNNYVGTLTVTLLDSDGVTPKYTQEYIEAYPKTINAIELNHSTQNSVARVTADFQYAYWNPK